MARPTDLTDQVQAKIIQAIIGGNYFETACRYAGIAPRTGYDWMARGEGRARARPGNERFTQFVQAVRLAEAQMEVGVVAQVRSDIAQTPRLGLDFLARRFPDRWANRDKVDIGGSGKEVVLRVVYGDPGSAEAEQAQGADGPAAQAAPEAGAVPSEQG